MNCSCIIPFYNEGERILQIVRTVLNCKTVHEIICVDDASTDTTFELIKKEFPNVTVLRLKKNLGKSGAIFEGVKKASGELLLFLDADLRGLKESEVDYAVGAMKKDSSIDMIILRRIFAPPVIKLNRSDVLITGERVVKRDDMLELMKKPPVKFQLEIAVNTYMFENRKKVFWVPSSAINISKLRKQGLAKGIWHELETYKGVLSYGGLGEYIRQIFFFGRNRLKS